MKAHFGLIKKNSLFQLFTKDSFQDYINVLGQVEPISNIYLEVLENGRVKQRFYDQGDMVKGWGCDLHASK